MPVKKRRARTRTDRPQISEALRAWLAGESVPESEIVFEILALEDAKLALLTRRERQRIENFIATPSGGAR